MACNKIVDKRRQGFIISGVGVAPTIPTVNEPCDAGWIAATDILIGEWAVNFDFDGAGTARIWMRDDSGALLVVYPQAGGGGGTPGAPINAIQFNNPLGTFAGDANFAYTAAAGLAMVNQFLATLTHATTAAGRVAMNDDVLGLGVSGSEITYNNSHLLVGFPGVELAQLIYQDFADANSISNYLRVTPTQAIAEVDNSISGGNKMAMVLTETGALFDFTNSALTDARILELDITAGAERIFGENAFIQFNKTLNTTKDINVSTTNTAGVGNNLPGFYVEYDGEIATLFVGDASAAGGSTEQVSASWFKNNKLASFSVGANGSGEPQVNLNAQDFVSGYQASYQVEAKAGEAEHSIKIGTANILSVQGAGVGTEIIVFHDGDYSFGSGAASVGQALIHNGTSFVPAALPSATTVFEDLDFKIIDDGDNTKEAVFEASAITTGTKRTFTFPDQNGTLAVTSDIDPLKVEQIDIFIEAPSVKTYTLRRFAKYAGTINDLTHIIGGGTDMTIDIEINGTNVTGLTALTVNTVETTTNATALNTFLAGDTIDLVVSAITAPTDAAFSLKITRS